MVLCTSHDIFQDWEKSAFSRTTNDLTKTQLPPSLSLGSNQHHASMGIHQMGTANNHHNTPDLVNSTGFTPENDAGALSPQLPSQADLLGVYRLLQEAREHPPSLLDLLLQSQSQNNRHETQSDPSASQSSIPMMNTSVPPPSLISSRQREHRPKGALADNKPFPASLASQVRSSGPPHQSHIPSRRHQEESEMLARQFSNALSLTQPPAPQEAQHHGMAPREPYPAQLLPPPPRCFPPYFPGPMLPPHFPPHHFALPQPPQLFAPYYNLARTQKKMSTSHRLHAHLEVCYEQFRQLEKERKQTEARLASCLPGRHWSSANTLPVPKLPPNPTRVDRLIIDNIREHCRLLTLIGKMEHLGAYKVPLTVHLAISNWKTAVQQVEEARRAELEAHKLNHNLLVFRGPAAAAAAIDETAMEEKVESLVASIRRLFTGIRGARTACWATLTCTALSVKEREAAEKAKVEAAALEEKTKKQEAKEQTQKNAGEKTQEAQESTETDKAN
ncbi:hypothetical protein B566_EDAN006235 [Ephemera danica]|nr:hypothetical protein B566_EDAN006235 [Ephemera danica]